MWNVPEEDLRSGWCRRPESCPALRNRWRSRPACSWASRPLGPGRWTEPISCPCRRRGPGQRRTGGPGRPQTCPVRPLSLVPPQAPRHVHSFSQQSAPLKGAQAWNIPARADIWRNVPMRSNILSQYEARKPGPSAVHAANITKPT
jgi:hypothetical protein